MKKRFLTNDERDILVNVLTYHYRKDSATCGCGCGWLKIGYSHPQHVAEVFEESVIRTKE